MNGSRQSRLRPSYFRCRYQTLGAEPTLSANQLVYMSLYPTFRSKLFGIGYFSR
jgi:hypothetical protein